MKHPLLLLLLLLLTILLTPTISQDQCPGHHQDPLRLFEESDMVVEVRILKVKSTSDPYMKDFIGDITTFLKSNDHHLHKITFVARHPCFTDFKEGHTTIIFLQETSSPPPSSYPEFPHTHPNHLPHTTLQSIGYKERFDSKDIRVIRKDCEFQPHCLTQACPYKTKPNCEYSLNPNHRPVKTPESHAPQDEYPTTTPSPHDPRYPNPDPHEPRHPNNDPNHPKHHPHHHNTIHPNPDPNNDPHHPNNDPHHPNNDTIHPNNDPHPPNNDPHHPNNDPHPPNNDPHPPNNDPIHPNNDPNHPKHHPHHHNPNHPNPDPNNDPHHHNNDPNHPNHHPHQHKPNHPNPDANQPPAHQPNPNQQPQNNRNGVKSTPNASPVAGNAQPHNHSPTISLSYPLLILIISLIISLA